MKTTDKVKRFTNEVFLKVNEHHLWDAAAALSFRSLMAIIPAMMLSIIMAGVIWGRETVSDWIFSLLEGYFGSDALVLEKAVEEFFGMMTNFVFSGVIMIVIIWASVTLINHVRKIFFSIFNIEIEASGIIKRNIKSRIISFFYTLLFLVLIITAILGQGSFSVLLGFLRSITGEAGAPFIFGFLHFLIFFMTIFVVFGVIYWMMSTGTLYKRSILLGSAVSSVLFVVFNTGLSVYVSYSATMGVFGASSFLFVLLIWIYYSSFTIFLGGVVASVANNERKRRKKEEAVYI